MIVRDQSPSLSDVKHAYISDVKHAYLTSISCSYL
jgi:hypothetical protein